MPSVPSSKESTLPTPAGPGCPHAAKMRAHTNGDLKGVKVLDGPFSLSSMAEVGDRDLLNVGKAASERKWIRPDLPSKCTWRVGVSHADSPHTHPPKKEKKSPG